MYEIFVNARQEPYKPVYTVYLQIISLRFCGIVYGHRTYCKCKIQMQKYVGSRTFSKTYQHRSNGIHYTEIIAVKCREKRKKTNFQAFGRRCNVISPFENKIIHKNDLYILPNLLQFPQRLFEGNCLIFAKKKKKIKIDRYINLSQLKY